MMSLLNSVKRRMSSREGNGSNTNSGTSPLARSKVVPNSNTNTTSPTTSTAATNEPGGLLSSQQGPPQIASQAPPSSGEGRKGSQQQQRRPDSTGSSSPSPPPAAGAGGTSGNSSLSGSLSSSGENGTTAGMKSSGGSGDPNNNSQNNFLPRCSEVASSSLLHHSVPASSLSSCTYGAGVTTSMVDKSSKNNDVIAAFASLPPLQDLSPSEHLEVLKKKIAACRDHIFDFRNVPEPYSPAGDPKLSTLTEILEFLNESSRRGFATSEQIAEDLISMLSANLFRALPPPCPYNSTSLLLNDPEEAEPNLDPAWPHLQILYEILLRFIMSPEITPKIAKRYIDTDFILRLLDLFSSEDPRERDYLKTIMHRIYGKIMALRAFIRKAIQQIFNRYIHEEDKDSGVSELLEILGSIINGFAQPLKEEHKVFLLRSMVPLHKARNILTFHQQLTYCMTQYIEKDAKLVEPIIHGLLRYWPVANTPKEVLFLNEVEEILELTPPAEFQKICVVLFTRLADCIRSPHFQVSERALFFWNNTRVSKLINLQRTQVYPLIVEALHENTTGHWNQTVQSLTFNVCKLISEADPQLYEQLSEECVSKDEARRKTRQMRERRWRTIAGACD